MKLSELTARAAKAELRGDENREVSGLCYDSRQARPGDLFFCVPGHHSDGHDFAAQAVSKGAAALVVERFLETVEAPQILVPSARKAMAVFSSEFLGRPSAELSTIGITGTNGKTSTAYLCSAVLSHAGRNPGLIGTIQAHLGQEVRPLRNTTPESVDLQLLLREMVDRNLDSVVMEVSSHALALERVHSLPFDVAVFTNLTQDHLDFHHTMENYFQAKMKLFRGLGSDWGRYDPPYAVVNLDDPMGERICAELRVPYITYGFAEKAHVRATALETGPEGASFTLSSPLGEARVELQLSGLFNVSNALAAISAGLAQRIELVDAVRGVESVAGIRGRFELVREGQDFTVVVDYAHTPDGLENLLAAARQVTPGKVLTVMGCGGDRDAGKRPLMGEIAGRLSDLVLITSDNPRSEDPEKILDAIEGGLKGCEFEREVDRASAIGRAINLACPGDTVVIAGKGHETYQIFADETIAFDDVEVARAAITARLGKLGKAGGHHWTPSLWTEQRRALKAREQQRL